MSDELPGFSCGCIEMVGEPLVGANIWINGDHKLWMCWDEVVDLHDWLEMILARAKEDEL